ncbi:MAG TPA: aldehyde dehydrogenase family protein [Anaerolineales bacterium]|nr:aldehyde dehydrogenase family protein [Anaerolineales bacterium]
MATTNGKIYPNLIGGEWRTSDDSTLENRNPADYNEIIGLFPMATLEDTRIAIKQAGLALPAWARTPAPVRGAILDKASQIISERLDEIARTLTREEGKTLAEAKGEVMRARDIFKYYAGEGWRQGGEVLPNSVNDELLYTRREPLGVVSIITPWNFPIAIPAWKIAPALIYGNTVVFKPAEDAPLTALMMVEALVEAGLPPGVINFLTGDGDLIGTEMTSNPHVNGISFTGSHNTGTRVYQNAIKHMARVQLEMGGKNALVVLKDADITLAVKLAITGGFGLTGQACTATSRVIAEEEIADEFISALISATKNLVVGNGLENGVQMGPLVNQDQLQTSQSYMTLGQEEGARLLLGGEVDDGKGYFAQATIFDHVQPTMRIAQEEIFGPVISVMRASGIDDAIEKANAIHFGLSASVVTNNLKLAFAFANQVNAGVVKINAPTTGVALNAPFGGFKHSSANTFKEQGQAAVEFYTRTKTIYVNHG